MMALKHAGTRRWASALCAATLGVITITVGMTFVSAVTGAPAGTARTLTIYNIHNQETTTVTFKKDGAYVPDALKKLNHALRDWRTNDEREMDPKLFDIIWELHEELGSKEPVHLISGYRSSETNEGLRKGGGGQAKNSRHIMGKAADIHFPDVAVRQIRYAALVREQGGVGYYPTSALPFVHVDTDRVRHWPPMPRYELALLFPSGSSKHVPSDGNAITKDDVRVAQSKYKDLAVQVAAFFDVRGKPDPNRTILASLEGPFPVPAPARAPSSPGQALPFGPSARPAAVSVLAAKPERMTEVASLTPAPTPAPPRALAPSAAIMQDEYLAATGRQLSPPAPIAQRPTPQAVASVPAPVPVSGPRPKATAPTPVPATSQTKSPSSLDPMAALMAREVASLDTAEQMSGPTFEIPALANSLTSPSTRTATMKVAGLTPAAVPPSTQEPDDAMTGPTPLPRPPGDLTGETLKSWGSGYAQAPEFDDEHPDELSYRPFPLGPILTNDVGPSHPVLAALHTPNHARVFELIGEVDPMVQLSFRPGRQVAELMMAGRFSGDRVSASTLMGPRGSAMGPLKPADNSGTPIKQRPVATSLQ